MLAPGRTLAELVAVAERVYGPPANINVKVANVYACLGALRGRTWGEQNPETVARIRAAAREVVNR